MHSSWVQEQHRTAVWILFISLLHSHSLFWKLGVCKRLLCVCVREQRLKPNPPFLVFTSSQNLNGSFVNKYLHQQRSPPLPSTPHRSGGWWTSSFVRGSEMTEESRFFWLPCRGGRRLSVESLPGVKVLLELGACISDMEALLADRVVAMETDQHGVSRGINPFSGLKMEKQRKICLKKQKNKQKTNPTENCGVKK